MFLKTSYLGMTLRSPLVVSASPQSAVIDNIKQMEDCGAAAVVLYSMFEEQVRSDARIRNFYREHPTATPNTAEALFPSQSQFHTTLDGYLRHISKAKEAVNIPIIASLNCMSMGHWTEFAAQIEQAGANALELDIYYIPTGIDEMPEQIESRYVQILKAVKSVVQIPVAVKLTPYFTNVAEIARQLDQAGANGLVLFNRFYQPDFEPSTLRLLSSITLSTRADTRLALHWIALLSRHLKANLAATGGIHTAEDVVKMLMVGASVTMMTSVLLKEGIEHLKVLETGLADWMDANNYDNVSQLQGLVSQFNTQNPADFERWEYMRGLTSYKPVI